MNSTTATMPRVRDTSRRYVRGVVIAVCALLVVSCQTAPEPADRLVMRIGAGPDAESQLIAEILVVALDVNDIDGVVVTLTGSGAARRALLDGRVDMRIAYTGEAWLDELGRPDPPSNPRDSFFAVRDFDQNLPVTWLTPPFGTGLDEPPANATFALMLDPSGSFGSVETLSQLASQLSQNPDQALCVDEEFRTRADGLRSLLAVYSVPSNQPIVPATPQEAVLAVAAGECAAGLTSTTDGGAWLLGLRPLRDDLGVFPAFVVAIQLRADAATAVPNIQEILAPVVDGLTTSRLGQLNARIVAGDSVRSTAQDAYGALSANDG